MIYLDCKVCFPEGEWPAVSWAGLNVNPISPQSYNYSYSFSNVNAGTAVFNTQVGKGNNGNSWHEGHTGRPDHHGHHGHVPHVAEPSAALLLGFGLIAIMLYRGLRDRIFSRRN